VSKKEEALPPKKKEQKKKKPWWNVNPFHHNSDASQNGDESPR